MVKFGACRTPTHMKKIELVYVTEVWKLHSSPFALQFFWQYLMKNMLDVKQFYLQTLLSLNIVFKTTLSWNLPWLKLLQETLFELPWLRFLRETFYEYQFKMRVHILHLGEYTKNWCLMTPFFFKFGKSK